MQKFFLSILLLSVLSSVYSKKGYSGGWTSSGGDLFHYSLNPWFVGNSLVRYCVEVDETSFSIDKNKITKMVADTFKFWEQDFKSAPFVGRLPFLQIDQRVFWQEDCSDDRVQIKFQFGTLSKPQREYLIEPQKHAGVAVLTAYDEVELNGKGFVYISGDRGSLKFEGGKDLIDIWSISNGHLLFLTLIHEVGHLFGIKHSGAPNEIMSEEFIDNLFLRKDVKEFAKQKIVPSYFQYWFSTKNEYCTPRFFVHHLSKQYFGMPKGWKCLKINSSFDQYRVLAKKSKNDHHWQLLGEVEFETKEIADFKEATVVYLDWNKQKVFERYPQIADKKFLTGVRKKAYYRKIGSYVVKATGEKRYFVANYLEGNIMAGGILNGVFIPSFENASNRFGPSESEF